jgi:hypothetical protein
VDVAVDDPGRAHDLLLARADIFLNDDDAGCLCLAKNSALGEQKKRTAKKNDRTDMKKRVEPARLFLR